MNDYPFLIEYRYKWQTQIKSYCRCKNLDEIIDWLKRFRNNTLEDHTEIINIEEIRITFQNFPIVIWIQMYKKIWGQWENVFMVNDYPLGNIFSFEDVIKYLETFAKFERK